MLSKPIFSQISQPSELEIPPFGNFTGLWILKKCLNKIKLKKVPANKNHLLNGSCTDSAVGDCLHLQTEPIYKNEPYERLHRNLWEINAHGFYQEVAMNYYSSKKYNKLFPHCKIGRPDPKPSVSEAPRWLLWALDDTLCLSLILSTNSIIHFRENPAVVLSISNP